MSFQKAWPTPSYEATECSTPAWLGLGLGLGPGSGSGLGLGLGLGIGLGLRLGFLDRVLDAHLRQRVSEAVHDELGELRVQLTWLGLGVGVGRGYG